MKFENFYEEAPQGVEPQSPAAVEPAQPAATVPSTPGETPVTTPEPEKQYVPLERFQEVNNKAKEAAEKAAALEARMAALGDAISGRPAAEEVVDLDPEAERMLEAWAKKNGFARMDDLAARDKEVIFARDMADLAKVNDGFSPDKVAEYVKSNPDYEPLLVNKAGYQLVWEKMTEAERLESTRKAALAEAANPSAYAEKPGVGGATPPSADDTIKGLKGVAKIRAIRERIQSQS